MKMKRRCIGLLVCILSALAACAPATPTVAIIPTLAPTPALTPTPLARPTPERANFDATRAFDAARKLAGEIGARVAGASGAQAAADYIASEFEKYGLQVTRQPFEFEGWEDRGTTAQLVSPENLKLDAQALQYSVGGKVDGEVVLVPGLGNRADFAQVNARDKIALVKRGVVPFSVKAQNAAEVGARALLIYNDAPTSFTGTLRERVSIPTIALSGKSGQDILKLLKNGSVRANIASDATVEKRAGYNVIGTLKGKTDETIVLGGHYDSVSAGPGAGDNASGIATLIELARVAGAGAPPQHTLVFIAFDAEELGMLGSRAYVDSLSDAQLAKLRGMLNFDMLGAGGGPLLLMGDGKLALLSRASAKELDIDARNSSLPANAGSDHESFARRGVDTVFFMRDYDLLHTPEDTLDQIKLEYLDQAGRVAQRVLERLDAAPKADSSNQDSLKLMPFE